MVKVIEGKETIQITDDIESKEVVEEIGETIDPAFANMMGSKVTLEDLEGKEKFDLPEVVSDSEYEELINATEDNPLLEDDTEEEAEDNTEENEEEEDSGQTETDKTKTTTNVPETEEKKEFVFDKKKYQDEGITDEKALKYLEQKDKEVFNKDQVIGRQGQKIGDQKKDFDSQLSIINSRLLELAKSQDLTDEEFNELSIENPAEAQRQREAFLKVKEEKAQLETEKTVIQSKSTILEKIPDYADKVNLIAEIIKEDTSPEVAANYIKNPYLLSPTTAINLARVADLRKAEQAYKAEIDGLKKQIKEGPDKTLARLKKIGKNSTANPKSEGGPSNRKASSGSLPGLMSTSDLNDEVERIL